MPRGIYKGAEERRAYWAMVLPAFLLYLLVLAFPILLSIVLSLSNFNGGRMFGGDPWRITGFQQYAKLVTDPQFWLALKNNVYIVLISVFGQLPLGFIFAYLIYRKIVKFGEFWQGVLYMPSIISVIVIGIMWKIIFSPSGLIADMMNGWYAGSFSRAIAPVFNVPGGFTVTDGTLRQIIAASDPAALSIFTNPVAELKDLILSYPTDELPVLKGDLANLLARKWSPDFLAKPDMAMIPIMFVVLWCWTGMYLILFLANMQKIDVQIIEAARIDGASEGQVMGRIVLPSLSGVIVNAAILCIAGSLNSFALIFAMTGGGPGRVTQLLSIYMYQNAFIGSPDYPLANAIALSIVIFSFILIVLTKVAEKRYGGRE
jgi:raffinose/stachyose/melibiose transport system permease protein